MMKKNITVMTNDPVKSKLSLTITGEVEKLVTISSQRVRLIGPAGQQINASVIIIPEKRYAFKIIEAKAKDGKHIAVLIDEKKTPEGTGYVVTVQNLKKEKGRYVDTILLKTTSEFRPTIQIRVIGNIT
jgi:hypothetical protein